MEAATQKDWEDRHFHETVVRSLKVVAEVVNRFEKSAQHRLGEVSAKLCRLEHSVSVVECKLASAASLA